MWPEAGTARRRYSFRWPAKRPKAVEHVAVWRDAITIPAGPASAFELFDRVAATGTKAVLLSKSTNILEHGRTPPVVSSDKQPLVLVRLHRAKAQGRRGNLAASFSSLLEARG
jgi:hypothetical protein